MTVTSNVSAMTVEEMKKELIVNPEETNGNVEICLNICQTDTNIMKHNRELQSQYSRTTVKRSKAYTMLNSITNQPLNRRKRRVKLKVKIWQMNML